MDKKGFFFTVVVLVLLSFLLISVTMWSRIIEAKEGCLRSTAQRG